ncbi:hypothetical protein ACFC1T_09320 [Kitasatospora sp. NPDC056076]|uniref:hypothetical protein n=1 Tax=Kitasatospora sp. NPDC056076 TaxID=3345703 RepID=UPI0035E09CCE
MATHPKINLPDHRKGSQTGVGGKVTWDKTKRHGDGMPIWHGAGNPAGRGPTASSPEAKGRGPVANTGNNKPIGGQKPITKGGGRRA